MRKMHLFHRRTNVGGSEFAPCSRAQLSELCSVPENRLIDIQPVDGLDSSVSATESVAL